MTRSPVIASGLVHLSHRAEAAPTSLCFDRFSAGLGAVFQARCRPIAARHVPASSRWTCARAKSIRLCRVRWAVWLMRQSSARGRSYSLRETVVNTNRPSASVVAVTPGRFLASIRSARQRFTVRTEHASRNDHCRRGDVGGIAGLAGEGGRRRRNGDCAGNHQVSAPQRYRVVFHGFLLTISRCRSHGPRVRRLQSYARIIT